RACQLLHLLRRRLRVRRVGVGHGLHHHRRAAADEHAADVDLPRHPAHQAHGSVKRATSTRVYGFRSNSRPLCSMRTCEALPITKVKGPRPCTTRSAPARLREDTSWRPLASVTSSHASSLSTRMTMRWMPEGGAAATVWATGAAGAAFFSAGFFSSAFFASAFFASAI